MWMEELANGKFKFVERYTDPYTRKEKKVSVTLTSKSSQAKNKAIKLLNDKIDIKTNSNNTKEITIKELYNIWFTQYSNSVKETTLLRNSWHIKSILKHIDVNIIINNLDVKYIQSIIDKLYYEDEYSFSTVKQCRSIINSILEYAVDLEYINYNPTSKTKLIKKKETLEQQIKISDKFLEKDELSRILKVLRNDFHSYTYANLVEFIALTGLRFGEATALIRSDLSDNELSIISTLDYQSNKLSKAKRTTPKTKNSTRKILLSKRAKEILLVSAIENKNSEYFFLTRQGNPIAISNFNNSLKRAAIKASVDKDVSSHILRHTHISLLAENNIPLKAIMQRVGHSKPETTLQIYTHVTKKMQDDIVNTLNDVKF
ncbi:tyrosine-type recombinase/integrase [Vagococcus fluvialis]|uniref:tyrosine-type recombinase/integrase n=1 Tax=Vagococcus fluvialis TaxID=2738 RepID=UPI003BF086F4